MRTPATVCFLTCASCALGPYVPRRLPVLAADLESNLIATREGTQTGLFLDGELAEASGANLLLEFPVKGPSSEYPPQMVHYRAVLCPEAVLARFGPSRVKP